MSKKRRRKPYYRDIFVEDPNDGLGVNGVVDQRVVSKRRNRFSIFDADNICVELETRLNGRRFYRVSIINDVRKANVYKTLNLNRYKDRVNKRRGF